MSVDNALRSARTFFANRWLYVAWCLASAAALALASYVDPHIFGLSAFVAAAVSGLVALGAAVLNWRSLPWALVAALPTVLAFLRLSTYKWA